MANNPEPFPSRDVIVTKEGKPRPVFTRWVEQSLQPRIDASPNLLDAVTFPNQNAAIPLTAIGPTRSAGMYEFSAYHQVVTPDGGGSSFQVTLSWTYGGVPQSETFALKNGDLTTEHEGLVYALRIDGGTVISYAVAYASTTPGAMHYDSYASVALKQLVAQGT